MIELSEMIRELRQQLTTAVAEGTDGSVRFELGPVEIEATVAVSREAGADSKVRLWVVDAGANGKYAHARTQRITLTLNPRAAAGDGSPARPLLIADGEVDGER
ncbi:trypco2 family protein [Streptomyces naphthomycinicus]|uniref:trypco2 family protein n=1 Tax=Streptomyces naphthomycinicus TaxID=2872625 RepID=UPI001CECB569|nr:trypco2 family protein [Streptomyces sp. TML10]